MAFQPQASDPPRPLIPPRTVPIPQRIDVYHPDYPTRTKILALSVFPNSQGVSGIPLLILLDCCYIIAQNRNGKLRALSSDVDIAIADVWIPSGKYTYHVSGEFRYPICTNFLVWKIPEHLPARWLVMGSRTPTGSCRLSSLSTRVKVLDTACVLTGEISRLQACHLVPRAELAWWRHNGMNEALDNDYGVDSEQNVMTLRADLNASGMDEGHFVFAPHQGVGVVLCLTDIIRDLAEDHHLRCFTIADRLKPHCFFARFAWGLFKSQASVFASLPPDTKRVLIHPDLTKIIDDLKNQKRMKNLEKQTDLPAGTALDIDAMSSPASGDMAEGSADIDIESPKLDLFERVSLVDKDPVPENEAQWQSRAPVLRDLASRQDRLKTMYLPQVSELLSANIRIATVGEEDNEQVLSDDDECESVKLGLNKHDEVTDDSEAPPNLAQDSQHRDGLKTIHLLSDSFNTRMTGEEEECSDSEVEHRQEMVSQWLNEVAVYEAA
ncbi:hypothetical protein MIND_00781800 [Mycena indigotica]|uniref:HNH nuclease domain-containing protein n=1 Tax=Mycena indigotica TaxID=2126181 RepID=A0A8H6SMP2_9AGAR|nr:uncharacterized protein MIND_00781800 [Mycena indigotica]KAF7302149.1 hypothetical protein MIND_00781800 [Mycena indigotica]